MRILYVVANPKTMDQSYSMQIGAQFMAELKRLCPDVTVETVDCYADYIPLIDANVLTIWGKAAQNIPLDESQRLIATRMEQIVDQFLAADVYVFVTPLWNLSYPPMFKAYLDNVIVVQKTFKYTATGSIGLLQGLRKQVVHIQAAGGVHSAGSVPEYANSHLKGLMQFIGIEQYHYIVAEGMAADPAQADRIVADAKGEAAKVAALVAQAQ